MSGLTGAAAGRTALAGILLVHFAALARADADYSLFNPVPDSDMRPFCTDRPTKGTGPCTIDVGHIQIESDVFNATFDHEGGVTTDTFVYTDPNIKLGITDNTDVELNFAPFVQIVARDKSTGARNTVSGFGDIFLRGKTNFAGNSGGDFGFALEPFLKLPTASDGIGNGAVEGGVVAPFAFTLSSEWSLSATPEIDVLKMPSTTGRHPAGVFALGLSRPLSDTLAIAGELWANVDGDPSGATEQYSFDLAATWQPPGTEGSAIRRRDQFWPEQQHAGPTGLHRNIAPLLTSTEYQVENRGLLAYCTGDIRRVPTP